VYVAVLYTCTIYCTAVIFTNVCNCAYVGTDAICCWNCSVLLPVEKNRPVCIV